MKNQRKRHYKINWENVCMIAILICIITFTINSKKILEQNMKPETIKNESVISMNCDLNK